MISSGGDFIEKSPERETVVIEKVEVEDNILRAGHLEDVDGDDE